jgi:molecular chaperone DnaK
MESGEKEGIESAIRELEEAMKGDDKDRIESLTKALGDVSAKMAERLYAQNASTEPGPGAAGGGAQDSGAKAGGDDVVDAEFEEVKDDKK